jgi:hypothetical protein
VFEAAADDLPPLFTDEGKVSQILRNFISNALKFTERGEVRSPRVCAGARDGDVLGRPASDRAEDQERIVHVLAVADTGIGIARRTRRAIFEEFTQHAAQAWPLQDARQGHRPRSAALVIQSHRSIQPHSCSVSSGLRRMARTIDGKRSSRWRFGICSGEALVTTMIAGICSSERTDGSDESARSESRKSMPVMNGIITSSTTTLYGCVQTQ